MTENSIFLLDSNILIYNYDDADPKKHTAAKHLIDGCWDGKEKFAISTQNLSEFFSVTTTKKFLAKKDAIRIISDIIEFPGWTKLEFSPRTVLEAAKISDEHDMSYWDSLLAATMKQNGIFNLYTENVKDFKVPWLSVVNPFIEAGQKDKKVKPTDIKPINLGKRARNLSEDVDKVLYGDDS